MEGIERSQPLERMAIVGGLVVLACCGSLPAQPFLASGPGGPEFELAGSVTLDQADTTVKTYLKRADQYVADGSWSEAIETLRRVMEESGEKMVQVSPSRYISVREYCQLRFTSLPAEGLARYRSEADTVARVWFERGREERDAALLSKVVEEALASRWADDALWLLGEMAFEAGDFAAARTYWERIIPVQPPPGVPDTWLSVADTDLDLAAVRARLVLASILEGSIERAERQLAAFRQLHPGARGWLGGKEVDYAEALEAILAESAEWPDEPPLADWPTFAGCFQRNGRAAAPADPAGVVWRVALPPAIPASVSVWDSERPPPRVAERAETPLSYHPVVAGNRVFVNSAWLILALDADSGRPAWGQGHAVIFRDPYDRDPRIERLLTTNNLGVPRFTMTAYGGRLYARMGPPVTGRGRRWQGRAALGYLVCLDLEAEGRLVWRADPDGPQWAFDGAPVTDGDNVFCVLRRSEVQPQIHVVCLDGATGRVRWRRFVCSGETPARGLLSETTHTLLTLHGDTLFVNTNVGAVAALSARDGRIKWITLYPTVRRGNLLDPDPHWCRDLNPCLYHQGLLLVAPADSPRIYALEAATGQILWQTGPEVQDAIHLLGVAGEYLIASGWRLYWIGLRGRNAGRVVRMVPDSGARLGYGRGLLAGDCIWWPTRETIYVFDQRTGLQRRVIPWQPRGAQAGNLVVARGRLLVATSNELMALGPDQPESEPPQPRIAQGP